MFESAMWLLFLAVGGVVVFNNGRNLVCEKTRLVFAAVMAQLIAGESVFIVYSSEMTWGEEVRDCYCVGGGDLCRSS
jgi:hypothetical protein